MANSLAKEALKQTRMVEVDSSKAEAKAIVQHHIMTANGIGKLVNQGRHL